MTAEAQASAAPAWGSDIPVAPSSQSSEREAMTAAPLASSRLMAEAHRLEAALDRYRAWYKNRIAEEHALIAQLTAHRAKTAQGVQKADELSATLAGIRLKLAERSEQETPTV